MEPTIPKLPQPGWRIFGPSSGAAIPSILDSGPLHFVPSGRIAIGLALKQLGVRPDTEVLLPAYHCPSMIEPVDWLGAKPVYYRILPDTSPDLDDLWQKISPSSRAVLGVHFFGRVQNLSALQTICREKNIGLIEDCAHAFFGESDGTPVGAFGDVAIASLRKFFPIFDGGCLFSATDTLGNLKTAGLGARYQLKTLFDSIEEAISYGRLTAFKPIVAGLRYLRNHTFQKPAKLTKIANRNETYEVEYADPRFSKASIQGRMSIVSRFIFSVASRNRVAERRIENYQLMLQEFSQLTRARPVFPDLIASSIPYVFPLEIDIPEVHHEQLKKEGVPMWRWDRLYTDICPISNQYSRAIIQLPCHQELMRCELDHIIAIIRRILS